MEELTEREIEILHDTEFLKLKISVLRKFWNLLDDTRYKLLEDIKTYNYPFPERTDVKTGKISRGEFYKQLPYMVLDFPKLMKQDSILAIRTMFWWGNFFSCTMHLQGFALENYRKVILNHIEKIKSQNFYVCVNSTPWEYHFGEDNYQYTPDLNDDTLRNIVEKGDFIKLSKKISLRQWPEVPDFTISTFHQFMEILNLSSRSTP